MKHLAGIFSALLFLAVGMVIYGIAVSSYCSSFPLEYAAVCWEGMDHTYALAGSSIPLLSLFLFIILVNTPVEEDEMGVGDE